LPERNRRRMKKVTGFVGSPRENGNTHILVSKILEGAQKGGAETEIVLLGSLNIKECDGCAACWKGRHCPKDDDMNELYQKIIESDILVFGTPVYWYGPTAIMKAFLDRFVYFNCPENRVKIKGKSAAIAVPFEEDNIEAASLVVKLFEKSFEYLEMRFAGKIIVPAVGEKGEVLKKAEKLEDAYQLGRDLAAG